MPTPTEVFHSLLDGVVSKKWDRLPDLYAEDTLVVHPLSSGPEARLEGREQVREHFARAAGLGVDLRAENVVVHESTDPEVVIAEFTYRGGYDGNDVVIPAIFVIRVRDGLIVSSRDYAQR